MNSLVSLEESPSDVLRVQAAEVARLFSLAEEKIKLVEHLNRQLPIPSINELRYAGYHLVQYLKDGDKAELGKAENHCKRAIYDAVEAGVMHQLEMIQVFQTDFRMIALSEHITGYSDLKKQIKAAKELILKPKNGPTDRAAYYTECTQHLESLREGLDTLEDHRDDLIRVIKRQNRQSLATWSTLAVTCIAALFTVLAYVKPPASTAAPSSPERATASTAPSSPAD